MRSGPLAAAIALFSAALAAHADTFDFSFGTAASSFSGSGVLTVGAPEAPGEYLITAVTGSAETSPGGKNLPISSILAPGAFPTPTNGGTFPANDNTLFVDAGIGTLTVYGISFVLSNGAEINLYNPAGAPNDALLKRATGAVVSENVPITITADATTTAATPEPSSFALLATGLLSVVGITKRRLS